MFDHTILPLKRFPLIFPITTSLLLIQLVFFVVLWLTGHMTQPDTWIQYGAYVDWRIDQGEWWRLFTSALLNVTIWQLIFTLFTHYVFAPQLEWLLGRTLFLIFYILVIGIGNFGYYLFDISGVQTGCYSALYGMLGFYLYLYFQRIVDPSNGKALLLLTVINLILSLQTFFAHLLALVVGFVFASVVIEIKRLRAQNNQDDED